MRAIRSGLRWGMWVVGVAAALVIAAGLVLLPGPAAGERFPDAAEVRDCDVTIPVADLPEAVERVPDGSVVCVEDGTYQGTIDITREFTRTTTFRALNPYRAVLRGPGSALRISGAANVVVEGFRIHHTSSASGYVVYIRGSDSRGPAQHVAVRNNIIHDAQSNDLLKVHNGARDILIEGNLFYDQAPGEQHLDINSAVDVEIRANVMFNTTAAPRGERPLKHFIVIKGSNPGVGGVLGAEDVTVADNVMLNFRGGDEAWIAVGNDGKPYHEATDVTISDNLLLGNADATAFTPLQIMGATNVAFTGNRVLGDMPATSYGVRAGTKGDNPANGPITLTDNVWADPTGTMEAFADVQDTPEFELRGNTYWNGGRALPPEVGADPDARIRDPGVPPQRNIVLPVWDDGFASGSKTIAQEHRRLMDTYDVDRPGR